MVPTQPATNDLGYCFGEVTVVFRANSGTFYNPQIRFSSGLFTGTDFQGHAANYNVYLDQMLGAPSTPATATNSGHVTMYLPQGTYSFSPSVVPGSGTYAVTGLETITNVVVGCRQLIIVDTCLRLNLNAPACTNNPTAHITGSVAGCTNVASITYRLNGGPTNVVCSNCGLNPAFSFNILLSGVCSNNTLTVTATDVGGGVSSITTTIRYDATPPVIHCPTNRVVSACDTNGAIVNFTVTATDNCSGPVSIVCTPASGSLFPVGVTTVNCVATDECGNTNACSFTVTVGGAVLSIEHAVIIRWNCGGTLQYADAITGPWTDIPGATSPYCEPTSAAHRFYRTRQ